MLIKVEHPCKCAEIPSRSMLNGDEMLKIHDPDPVSNFKIIFVTSVKYFQEGVSTPSTWATSRACSGGPWPPTPPTGGRGCTRSAPPRRQLPRPRMRRPRRGHGLSTSPRRDPARWTAPSCCAATCATPPSPTPS